MEASLAFPRDLIANSSTYNVTNACSDDRISDPKCAALDVKAERMARLRAMYGARYDHRVNVIDWDFQTVIYKHSGVVHRKLFREWRQSGIGFECELDGFVSCVSCGSWTWRVS